MTDRWGRTQAFDAVVATCQSWLLTTAIEVDEPLFSHRLWMALDRTRYMQSSKTFVMVDRPFWNDRDPETGRQVMSMTQTERPELLHSMALTAVKVPYTLVRAPAWQKAMGCLTHGDKNISKRRAEQLFPSVKMTHALSDALLIAEFCRRVEGGR